MTNETKYIDYRNLKWLYQLLETNEEVEEVSDYLKSHNAKIKLEKTFDGQSGWEGEHVYLDGIDLSGNGYCFGRSKLLYHVRNYDRLIELSQTDEFIQFLKLKEKYAEVAKYVDQIKAN